MTNNDNKDPQITAEKACVEVPKEDTPYTLYLKQVAAIRLDLINQQAAELTQLKAKWEGLLEWVRTKIAECHNSDALCAIAQAGMLELVKSKLTESAQKVEPQELQEFRKTMREEVIPEIEKTVRNRQAAANKLDGVLYGDPAQIQKGENHD